MQSFGEFLQSNYPDNGSLVERKQLDEGTKKNLLRFLARLRRNFFARRKEPRTRATIKPWGKL